MSDIKPITMPNWGMNMEEGTVVQWLIGEGESFKAGEEIIEIETSKTVNVLEAPFTGTLRHKVIDVGETLEVGYLMGLAADAMLSKSEIDTFISGFVPLGADATGAGSKGRGEDADAGADTPQQSPGHSDNGNVNTTPVVRRLAQQLGVELGSVAGTGRGGRISKEDVEAAHAGQSAEVTVSTVSGTTASVEESEEIPLTGMRRNIAARLQASKQQAPHFRLVNDCEVDALLAHRDEFNQQRPDARLSINDYLIKACALALVEVPDCNVQFDGDTIRRFSHADICIAVALEGGLITPIIRSADLKGIGEIARESSALIAGAKAGELKPAQYEGGTFTLSNLGMYGIKQFDAIINPPQAAILAVGGVEQRVVVRDDKPAVAAVMTLSLSCDHRVIDGVLGARFLTALKEKLSAPEHLSSH